MILLLEFLARKRNSIVGAWLQRIVQGYAESTSRFLMQEQDRFRNPMGHVLRENLPALFDALLQGGATVDLEPRLDPIVRMRAVQDFSASQAVSFVFLLKEVVRQEARGDRQIDPDGSALAAFESRIDGLALLAFDLFVRCREQISDIKANELRRKYYIGDRLAARGTDPTKDDS